jgi:hypothetical protein
MDKKIACLRTHQENIDRYQGLLKTKLTEIEVQYLQRRLSEERFAVAMLQFMSPNAASATSASVLTSTPAADTQSAYESRSRSRHVARGPTYQQSTWD